MEQSSVPATDAIDARLREGQAIQHSDYRKLEELADGTIEMSIRAKLPVKTAEALTQKAWALLHLNNSEPAFRAALDALIIAREHEAKWVEHRALLSLSVIFDRAGLPEEALRLHHLQLEIVEQLGDPYQRASVLNNIGVAELTRDPQRALVTFLEALSIVPFDGAGYSRVVIIAWNAATAQALTGQYEPAMSHAVLARDTARQIDSRAWAARAEVVIAFIHGLQRNFALAHALFEEIETRLYQINLPVLTAEHHLRRGMIYLEERRIHEAVGVLEDAYQVAYDANLINVQIDVLKALVQAYEKYDDMAGVINTYKRMTEGVVRQQKRGADLRFAVLKKVFEIDRAGLEAKNRAAQLQTAALQKISEELRTPLEVIQSSAGIVEKYGDRISPEATRARLQEITTQVKWVTVMMDEVAGLLQPEDADFETESFTMASLTQAVLKDVASYQMDINRIFVEATGNISIVLHGTLDALRRTLVQLLTNALKFSDDVVHLRLSISGRHIDASVSDEGVGIPPEEQRLVLQPLYRASNTGEVTGSGVGLALVDRLVRGAGATFELVSAVGSGTTVSVRWPLS
ncbi:MAG: HAMP domain-containing histidine kinase [Chloroflexi bacterium]|nr:HAMP domain-containing histidine kinase [Chloroflexota bacterium]